VNTERTAEEINRQRGHEEAIEKERSDSTHTFWIGFLVGLALIILAWSAMKGWIF
jgi:hypothetical protein